MSLDIWVEADARLTQEQLIGILRKCSVSRLDERENEVHAVFTISDMTMSSYGNCGETKLKAQQPLGAAFPVARRCIFTLNLENHSESDQDLRRFLEIAVAETGAFLVASFQLEKTIYINNGSGLIQLA